MQEAIEIIATDHTLNEKQKKQIIDQLTKAITIIASGKTSWTTFFGILSHTIFILGSLGSLVGGAIALQQAVIKLNEAGAAVSSSSPKVTTLQIGINNYQIQIPSKPTIFETAGQLTSAQAEK